MKRLILLITIGCALWATNARAVSNVDESSAAAAPVPVATPIASSFSMTVPANRQSAVALQGSDADLTSLTYAIGSGPSHGTLSNLNTATGVVVYTPVVNFTGADSFTYTVTSGGDTSPAGTVTLAVTNAKTRIIDTVTDASGAPRHGTVTFILTEQVTTPSGISPAGATVSATLNNNGQFDISVYPSKSMSPNAYYQVWFADASDASTLNRELIGIYEIPLSTTTISLAAYKVIDTNLSARYTFASTAAINALAEAAANGAYSALVGSGLNDGVLPKYQASSGQLTNSIISIAGTTATINGDLTVNGSINGALLVSSFNSRVGAITLTAADVNALTGLTLDCSACTGLGTGTGGVINTGSTTVGGDSDVDGSGVVDIQTRGSSRIRIANDGKVGIGTASPLTPVHSAGGILVTGAVGSFTDVGRSDAQLELRGTDAIISLVQTTNPGNTTNEVGVANSGFNSAGTLLKMSSISSNWAVKTAGSEVGTIRLNAAGGGSDRIVFKAYGNGANGSAAFFTDSGTPPATGQVDINGKLKVTGSVGFGASPSASFPLYLASDGVQISGSDYAHTFLGNAAQDKGLVIGYDNGTQLGTVTSVGANSGLAFWTNNGGWAERLRIDTTGDTKVSGALSAKSNGSQLGATADYLVHSFTNAAQTKGLYFGYDNGAQLGTVTSAGSNSGISFWTNNGSWAERIKIDTAGVFVVNSGALRVLSLPAYANNAAALSGGLVAGDFYRNGDAVQVVH